MADIPMLQSSIGLQSSLERHVNSRREMKLVGLLSDTHILSRVAKLPQRILDIFEETSLIVHAGDLVHLKVIEDLERIAPVIAVHGNMDPQEVRTRFPEINSTQVLGWKIGVVHDAGALWGKGEMRRIAKEHGFDVLVFGHTHRPFLQTGPVIFINPGSPTNPLPPYLVKPSAGLLKVARQGIEPSLIAL